MKPTIEIHIEGPDWGDRNLIPVTIAQHLYRLYPDHEVRYFQYDPSPDAKHGVFVTTVKYPNGKSETHEFVRNWATTRNAIA